MRDRFLQDQLLPQCKEALSAKMVRVLQGASLTSFLKIDLAMSAFTLKLTWTAARLTDKLIFSRD